MKSSLLLITLIIVFTNQFIPKELNSLLLAIIIFMIIPFDKELNYNSTFKLLTPVILLLLIGLLSGPSYGNNVNRDYYRDIFYYSKVIIFFLGSVFATRYLQSFDVFLKYFAIFIVCSSVKHLLAIALNFHHFDSLYLYRNATGHEDMNEVIFLSICLSRYFNKDFKSLIPEVKPFLIITIVLVSLSFLAYLSRTMIIDFLIITLFLSNKINIREVFSKRNLHIFYTIIIITCLFSLVNLFVSLSSSNTLIDTIVEKFKGIPNEVFWNPKENSSASIEDIQNQWRGYEAYQGIVKFESGNSLQKMFGYGFGTLVDLHLTIKLANADYEQIPVLHNGYVFLLVKSGIFGLLLYLLFLYKLGFLKINYTYAEDLELFYFYQLLSALSIVSLFYTFANTGLFNPFNATVPIIFGFCWGNIQRRIAIKPD